MLSKSKAILSSHRDAATRVSTFLDEAHGIKLKPIVALEVIARALGAANWQVLSAMAEQGRAPRMGDVAIWGHPDDLPPVGAGSVLKDVLFPQGGTPMSDIIQDIIRRPASSSEPLLDLRADQSEVQSRGAPTARDDIWLGLVARCVSREHAVVGDLPESINRAETAMGIVFSPGQRSAVRSALEESICIITGEAGTGKSLVVEGIVRAAIASGLVNVFNTVRPRSHRIGNFDFPAGLDGFPQLRHMTSALETGPQDEALRTCDLLLIDERVLNDKYLLRDVVKKTPVGCRLVVVLDASTWPALNVETGALFKELISMEHARYIHMGEKMRQSPILTPPGEIIPRSERTTFTVTPLDVMNSVGPTDGGAPKNRTVTIITDGDPTATTGAVSDALGMPREAYHMNGFFENGDRPPTKTHIGNTYIYEAPAFQTTDRTGKWCIFRDEATVDALWAKIQQAVVNKELPAGLVSSPANAQRYQGTYLICVFTHEWRDQADVMRVREILRGMGVDEELGYKRDLDTANGVYGTEKEWFYRD